MLKKTAKEIKEINKIKKELKEYNINFDKFLNSIEKLMECDEATLVLTAPNRTNFTIDVTKLKKTFKYGYKDYHILNMMLYIIYTIFEYGDCSCTFIVFLNQKYKDKKFRKIYSFILRINDYDNLIFKQLKAKEILTAFTRHAEYNHIELIDHDIFCGIEKDDIICSFDR